LASAGHPVKPGIAQDENARPGYRLTIRASFRISENMGTAFHADDMRALKARWRGYLEANRLNTTQQRELIVDHFLRSRDHVSIDELLSRVRKRNKRVGYATVYRTLRLLVASGLALQRQFGDGQARFEVAGEHHDHLICTKCGLILEFEDDEIERLQERIAERLGGFKVVRHRHELYGLCPKEQGVPGGRCPNDEAQAALPRSRS
jgi:Fur family ferric uptake transcriptional regulator